MTNGTITLQIPEAFENLSVKIVNAVGKLIYQQDNISDGSSIDVGQLVPGVYFVQVIQGSSSNVRFAPKKLIKS